MTRDSVLRAKNKANWLVVPQLFGTPEKEAQPAEQRMMGWIFSTELQPPRTSDMSTKALSTAGNFS
ncbi:MAG: hypothetical protein ABI407_13175 [Bradyrhizobium sp.]